MFDAAAPYYKYRTPYSPGFFRQMRAKLSCNSATTDLLDIACGNGLLSAGMMPFVRSITAIDASEAMLAEAPRHKTITYIRHGLNEAPFTGARAEHAMIGRALHWLPPENLSKTLESVVEPGGRLAICASDFAETTPWKRDFKLLLQTYSDAGRLKHLHRGREILPTIGWQKVDLLADAVQFMMKPEFMIGHALSYSRGPKSILADMPQFKKKLGDILRPHLTTEKVLQVEVLSFAFLYEKRS